MAASAAQTSVTSVLDPGITVAVVAQQTPDYYIAPTGRYGLGLFANRDIEEGDVIFKHRKVEDFEFPVANKLVIKIVDNAGDNTVDDVDVGGRLIHEIVAEGAEYGVPDEDLPDDRWILEVPGLMMNHNCEGNCKSDVGFIRRLITVTFSFNSGVVS